MAAVHERMSIPVVDFAPFLGADTAGKVRVAAEVQRACESVGFFYLAGHVVVAAVGFGLAYRA